MSLEDKASGAADALWVQLVHGAETVAAREPLLAGLLRDVIFKASDTAGALSLLLAGGLGDDHTKTSVWADLFLSLYDADLDLQAKAEADLRAVISRDPAASEPLGPFLYFKGFHAMQAARLSHALWLADRAELALYLQSRISAVWGVDIHPAARLGTGLMFDHATGLVIGETAVVGDNVSLLHGVTLGGTGKETGDRHPKIGDGVMIGAHASILGNIKIGKGSSVAAGSVVLTNVPPHVTVAGVPAQIVGKPRSAMPSAQMDQQI